MLTSRTYVISTLIWHRFRYPFLSLCPPSLSSNCASDQPFFHLISNCPSLASSNSSEIEQSCDFLEPPRPSGAGDKRPNAANKTSVDAGVSQVCRRKQRKEEGDGKREEER